MRLRDIILRFMPPKMRADAETDSRNWVATCPKCEAVNSIWDIGGVRYKARSAGKRIRLRCPQCGERGMHAVEHRPGSGVH